MMQCTIEAYIQRKWAYIDSTAVTLCRAQEVTSSAMSSLEASTSSQLHRHSDCKYQ